MAKLIVVAVHDTAVNAFNRPFFVTAVGAAVRSFTDEVNRVAPDNPLAAHPDDYTLWYLGHWDEDSGVFSSDDQGARPVARGKDVRSV